MSSSRTEMGGEEDLGAAADMAPQIASLLAQEQEKARVTLHRCMKTLVKLLRVRGYSITEIGGTEANEKGEIDVDSAIEPFKNKQTVEMAESNKSILMRATVVDPPKFSSAWALGYPKHVNIIVMAIGLGNVESMKEIMDKMAEENIRMAIIVSRQSLSAYSRKYLTEVTGEFGSIPNGVVQHFQYAELQAAIVDHSMVPRHVPLNAAMRAVVVERYAGGKFPRMLITDPMVRFLGLPLGTIICVREVYGREQSVLNYFEVYDIY